MVRDMWFTDDVRNTLAGLYASTESALVFQRDGGGYRSEYRRGWEAALYSVACAFGVDWNEVLFIASKRKTLEQR